MYNGSMLIISREKFTELCACCKYLFPISPHWLTCMQNAVQIGPWLAGTFGLCPLEKPSTAAAARYTPALALECPAGTEPLTADRAHSLRSTKRQTGIKKRFTLSLLLKRCTTCSVTVLFTIFPLHFIWRIPSVCIWNLVLQMKMELH